MSNRINHHHLCHTIKVYKLYSIVSRMSDDRQILSTQRIWFSPTTFPGFAHISTSVYAR